MEAILTIIAIIGGLFGLTFLFKHFRNTSNSTNSNDINYVKEKRKIINELKKNKPITNINNLDNSKRVKSIINKIGAIKTAGEATLLDKLGRVFQRFARKGNDKRNVSNILDGNGKSSKGTQGTSNTSSKRSNNTPSSRNTNKRYTAYKNKKRKQAIERRKGHNRNNSNSGLVRTRNKTIVGHSNKYILKNTLSQFKVSQYFAENPEMYKPLFKAHPGVDYGMITGTVLQAVFDGLIGITDFDEKGYGKYIMLWNWEMKLYALYAHLDDFIAKQGQNVQAGQDIVISGNTGRSTDDHLHFGLRPGTDRGGIKSPNNGYQGFIDPLGLDIKWVT